MLKTAEYPRPADDATLTLLCENMASETLELALPQPDENSIGRIAVLSPKSHAEYFSGEHFVDLHDDAELKDRIAGEFGDVLWYESALLAEKGIEMSEIVQSGLKKISSDTFADTPDIDSFNNLAGGNKPPADEPGKDLDDFPFSSYASSYVSPFVRLMHPDFVESGDTREKIIDAAVDLLWATTYLLNKYCRADLQSILDKNYQKLQARALSKTPQGQNAEDPRWANAGSRMASDPKRLN
jgi:NTP pyrophosphatase (non-canonical NTP hydrolase)